MTETNLNDGLPVPAPYDGLTPDRVLDAVASLGLNPDGRLLALNSYENRVYQVGLADAPMVVAKFYRPGRWSDAAIAEEHQFTQALCEADIPVVPPTLVNGKTLFEFDGFRFSVFRRQGGRAPEFDQPDVLEWMGRLLGRSVSASSIVRH
jgi:Ser/Thr protein kinase RdoA (MazF antagonist)